MRIAAAALSILTAVAVIACHSGNGGLVGQTGNLITATDLARAQADVFAQNLPHITEEHLASRPTVDLESVVSDPDWPGVSSEQTNAWLRAFYQERNFSPVFLSEGTLTEDGALVQATLDDSWAHALRPLDYGVDRIADALQALETNRRLPDSTEPLTLSAEDHQTLTTWLAGRSDLLDMEPEALQSELVHLVLWPEDDEPSPLPNVQAELERQWATQEGAERAEVEAELRFAAGFVDYAYDMRFFNPVWFDSEIREDEALLAEARQAAMLLALRSGAETGFAPVLDALPPPYEQYTRLVEAHRRYRAIVEEGGWHTNLEEANFRLGRRNDMVVPLRRRLHAEGYEVSDLESEEFDRELRDALKHYQDTHQWRHNGQLSEGVANSLNLSALRRARQIAITIQRWRESQIGDETYFVQVIIPDFHAEVWRDGNRDMRFRIITGDTQRYRDEETRELVFAHATPELDRPMRYVVFNPFWNVPRSIMLTEYDPLLEENPNWYKDNGYEVLYNEYGLRWVRQRPGPDNALGVVKFLFPNEHDVYMHDTPLRYLFDRTTRAFSHGCMRIENPMDLAYYLLENDRGWDPERVDEERTTGTEQWVTLRRPVPVHVDYYVVRVDDEGFVHFASDLYRRDAPRLAAQVRQEVSDVVADAIDVVQNSLVTAVEVSSIPASSASQPATASIPEEETAVAD